MRNGGDAVAFIKDVKHIEEALITCLGPVAYKVISGEEGLMPIGAPRSPSLNCFDPTDALNLKAINVGAGLLEKNGKTVQMGQLSCELSELSVSIFQHYQQDSKPIDAVISELADVLNMLPQLLTLVEEVGATELLERVREMKLARVALHHGLSS